MNDPVLGENRVVYSPGDVVRIKGDSTHANGTVVVANPTYQKALVRWTDPEQSREPEQWASFVELEKLLSAPVQTSGSTAGSPSVVIGSVPGTYNLSLAEAQERRRLQLGWSDASRLAAAAARRARHATITHVGHGPSGTPAYRVTDENDNMLPHPKTGWLLHSAKEAEETKAHYELGGPERPWQEQALTSMRGLDETPVYGGHPTVSGQPGGQPVAGPNDTMGQRPQQPPNLKEAQQGDPQYLTGHACSTCLWWDSDAPPGVDALNLPPEAVEGGCGLYHVDTGASQVCDSWQGQSGYDMAIVIEQTPMELMLSEEGAPRFRKVSLRTGVVAAATPDSSGRMLERPLEFVDGRSVNGDDGTPDKIGFDDIIESIDDPAFERITVPESHQDRPRENAGFVVGYRKLDDPDRPGHKILELEQEITEPEIAEKIKRGSIFGSSVGLLFNYVRKSDLRKFPVALKHNALTNVPWVRGLGAHVAASEEVANYEELSSVGGIPVKDVQVYEIDGTSLADEGTHKLVKEGKALSDGEGGYRWPIRNADELGKAKHAFGRAKPSERGKIKAWINKRADALGLPKMGESGANAAEQHSVNEGGDRVDDDVRDAALQLQLSESRDTAAKQQEEIDRLHADLHRRSVEETVAGWAGKKLDRLPGFLAKARDLMMADDGGPALILMGLSDDGTQTKRELSATDIVTELVSSLPFDESGDLKLGEQATAPDPGLVGDMRPRQHVQLDDGQSGSFDKSPDEVRTRAARAAEELGLTHLVPKGGDS